MTTPDDTLTPIPNRPGTLDPPDPRWAKACCGPAHGHTWRRDEPSAWPLVVLLDSHVGPQEYRVVHDLRARRPARDEFGNTLYMPVSDATPARWGRTP